MSWDIFVQDLPPEAETVGEISPDFRPSPVGKRSEIIESILSIIPTADFSDPAWGQIDGKDWWIEVNLGQDEDCHSFALHVRGGETAVGAIAAILGRLNLRAVDSQTGEFFVADEDAIESFRRWKKYLNHVARGDEKMCG
jgi:hypothetical protein